MSLILCGLMLAPLVRAEPVDAEQIPVTVTLRDSGYLLGDLLEERIEAQLPANASIDAESLPLPGRVAPWLEVRRTRLEGRNGNGSHAFVVTYPIFAEV